MITIVNDAILTLVIFSILIYINDSI